MIKSMSHIKEWKPKKPPYMIFEPSGIFSKPIDQFITEIILKKSELGIVQKFSDIDCNMVQAALMYAFKYQEKKDTFRKLEIIFELAGDLAPHFERSITYRHENFCLSDLFCQQITRGDIVPYMKLLEQCGLPIEYTGVQHKINRVFDENLHALATYLYDNYPDMVVSEDNLTFREYCSFLSRLNYPRKDNMAALLDKAMLECEIKEPVQIAQAPMFKI